MFENHSERVYINYEVNDFIVIICIFWSLFSIKYLDKAFEYNSNGSYRIIKLLGNDISTSFFIRCLFEENALSIVFLIFATMITAYTMIIRILEWENPYYNFVDVFHSLWFCFITMVTVGYGDFLPITLYGWLISFFICISGVLATYLITGILADKLKLKINEKKAL